MTIFTDAYVCSLIRIIVFDFLFFLFYVNDSFYNFMFARLLISDLMEGSKII